MKIKVVIEYDIPCIDKMTAEDHEVIAKTIENFAPAVFEFDDGGAMLAESWTVEVLE